jgi:predicted DNA-binding protein
LELQRKLSEAEARTGKGKNAIIVEALEKHLHTIEQESLAAEARRQSERVSRHEHETGWYALADTSGWR